MAKRARLYKNSGRGRSYAISCSCLVGRTADEIAVISGLPHDDLRETTVGAIRASGYRIVRQGKDPWHVQIRPPDPSVNDWRGLHKVFGTKRPNPAAA
jgi:hypothetical protein